MTGLDVAVIVVYAGAVLGIGVAASRRQRTAGDYFLGARDLPAFAIMLSIVATETSALTVISVPGIGARGDLTFLQLTIGYLLGRIGVAIWLLPGYFVGEQDTAYARLEGRFGAPTRRVVSALFLATRFLGDGVRVFAGAIPLALITGWPMPGAIVAIGLLTIGYTLLGGLRAVVWTDVLQLVVYVAGGALALKLAADMAGGLGPALEAARAAGKLRVFDLTPSLTSPYTLLAGVAGGALLSAASHGTDHLIVQRLLATRSLNAARAALVGSGVAVILQFALFLLVGTMLWAASLAPADAASDTLFPRFVVDHLPSGLAGLMVAGILAAAMSTLSSSINALGSAVTHDWYVPYTGRRDPAHLLRVGRGVSAAWGLALIAAALTFHVARAQDTPVVVLALAIASVTYGGLLGAYLLTGVGRVRGRDVTVAVGATTATMLVVLFAGRLAPLSGLGWLEPVGRLAWPWYVPLGTALTLAGGLLASLRRDAT